MEIWVSENLGLPVGESTKGRLSVTGEPYLTLCPTGEWKEGGVCPSWHPSPDHAWSAYCNTLERYASSVDSGVLYWRVPPEIDERMVLEKVGDGEWREVILYTIYSRLLISNRRALEKIA